MGAALTKLKGLVQTYEGYNFDQMPEIELDELLSYATVAIQAVKWEIENDFDLARDENSKLIYIGDIQSKLTYLADRIKGFAIIDETNNALSNPFNWILKELYKLIDHLQNHFGNYFDYQLKLPDGYLGWYKMNNVSIYHHTILKIKEHIPQDDLINLITDIISADQDSEKYTVKTWKQWIYLRFAIITITSQMDNLNVTDVELEMIKVFINLNFNSIYVYRYFIRYIEKFTMGEKSFQEKQQELLYLLKVFKQVRVDSPSSFDTQIQPLKLSVIESVEAELTYLEQQEKVYMQNLKATNPEYPSKFYFSVVITLAELMFFFRVMLEVKVIYTKFNSYLYEFISNHIRTAKAENISKKSMRNHFNNKPFPDRVVQNVRGWLIKMIAHIDLYYSI
ncbi:hypothetical protein [Mucilaginibacter jinjuensis]|uniref:Uncharacterized protein n=1 Tax=Mucilaginibacter jinjuensis TaxID=1176721 RepID=A0ABY7TAV3_9SPHI|nr:hypothetical protein [Mucilaginibacter jinjuensis]WCT13466.1 hypothetical protein PQO05_05900 [Mucilaginibacter jinjuensis]